MNKTELIVINKKGWIKALENVKEKYESMKRTNDLLEIDYSCALCDLADDVLAERSAWSKENCYFCIHTSSIGSGKICYDQKSFQTLKNNKYSVAKTNIKTINIRIAIADRLIVKLKAL